MNTTRPELRRLRLLEVCATVCVLIGAGRVLYEYIWMRGLFGWLADQQLTRIGHFDFKMTMLGAAVVYLLPVSFVFSHIKRTRARLIRTGILVPQVPDPLRETVATARMFVLLGVGIAAAGFITYYVVLRQTNVDAQRSVERLSLEAAAGLSAPATDKLKYVEINATCQTRAGWGWIKSDPLHSAGNAVHYRYLPLTRPGWQPGEPVRFFLQTTVDVYFPPHADGPLPAPVDYDGVPFAGSFEGELEGSALPLFAYNALQREGVVIASPYYVVESMPLSDRSQRISRQMFVLIPCIGAFFGLLFVLLGALFYWRREHHAALLAARRAQSARR